MYKISDLKITSLEAPNYSMTGLIEHPKDVNISLATITHNQDAESIEITYQSFPVSSGETNSYSIDQQFIRPEWAKKADIKVVDGRGALKDSSTYIFD